MANLNSDISEGDNVDDYDLKLNLTTSQKVHLQQFKKKKKDSSFRNKWCLSR